MMIDDIAATSSYVSLFTQDINVHNCLFWLQSKYYKFASFLIMKQTQKFA